jgi:hypothetical protein
LENARNDVTFLQRGHNSQSFDSQQHIIYQPHPAYPGGDERDGLAV